MTDKDDVLQQELLPMMSMTGLKNLRLKNKKGGRDSMEKCLASF